MPKPKKLNHYCVACNTEHTFIEDQFPFWYEKIIKGKYLGKVAYKSVYYCNKGIDCSGCKSIHKREGVTKILTDPETQKTYQVCSKWFKSRGNGEVEWDNWSPQEVMSGVHFGEERVKRYGPDTEDHSVVQSQQVTDLEQVLDEVEEFTNVAT